MIVINALATRAGGAAVRVREVTRRAPQSWRTGILLLHNDEAGIQVEAAPDRLVAGWPRLLSRSPAVPRRVLEAPVLRRLLRDRQVEAILHYGTYVPMRPLPGALNVLCFVSLAPWDPGPDARNPRNRVLRWLFERTHPRADLVVVQSEATRTFLQERYPETVGRLAVIRNGISLPALRRPRHRTGFLLLGDIHRYRRIDEVIQAYARLPDRVRAAHPLVIAGHAGRDGRATEDVLRSIRAADLDTVHVMGLVPRPRALELIAASCAFVSFASVENGPNALVEASAIGTPVVVSDIPVHREFAGHSAHFVREPTELTQALLAVATAPPADLPEMAGPLDTWDGHVAELGQLLAAAGALSGGRPSTVRVIVPTGSTAPGSGTTVAAHGNQQ